MKKPDNTKQLLLLLALFVLFTVLMIAVRKKHPDGLFLGRTHSFVPPPVSRGQLEEIQRTQAEREARHNEFLARLNDPSADAKYARPNELKSPKKNQKSSRDENEPLPPYAEEREGEIIPPKEAVAYIEKWLEGASDPFGIGGDMVRSVVEYEHSYFMALSPQGWIHMPKRGGKDFRPLTFSSGRVDHEQFEGSLWGQMGGATNGELVYVNAAADEPRPKIYLGLRDMPYDRQIWVEPRRSNHRGKTTHEGTASNDVFLFRGPEHFRNDDKNEYRMIGNGGSDIYDIEGFTVRVAVHIDKKYPDEKNVIITYGYDIGKGTVNELLPFRQGDDLVLAFVRNIEDTRLRIVDWYKGPQHRPDAILNKQGTARDAAYIEGVAARAREISADAEPN